IPWYMWMQPHGEAANYLYTKGYNVYALFLMISTAGIPAAVAKQTARYNSMNEYGLSKKLLFYTLRLMTIGGIICAGIMYLGAPFLAQGNADLIPVMRSLSVVLLIFPAMSVIRGFFQGNNNMKPYAISQIIEQIARVCYMLATAYIIMQVNQGSYKTAVVQSTFAAFIGVAFAMAVLLVSLLKERATFREMIKESSNKISFSGRQLVLQMIAQAIPFIIVGSGISIFKLIDQYSFESIMGMVTNYSAAKNAELFALISANPDKLTMVVIALGTAMATAGLPLITERFTKKDHVGLAKLV
ncbi:MAG: oligosaccharide flippase family protein, partial [Enterococcus sp.]